MAKIRFFLKTIFTILLTIIFNISYAQEKLLNPSFETPVETTNGNHLDETVPNWTHIYSANIVRPNASYTGGPTAPPTGGGNQYYDGNSTGSTETLSQTFTLTSPGIVDYSGWFSIRDMVQAGTATISIINSSNTTVSSTSVSFLASDAFGTWKQAKFSKLPLAAGTYTFSINLPDVFNTDLESVFLYPPLTVVKSSVAFSDPYNGTTNPKEIPGGVVEYSLVVTNPATYTVDSGTLLITDATPANLAFYVGDIGGAGSGPVLFTNGSPSSGLTYTYTSLASTTDGLDFSKDNGSTWTYTPVPNAANLDPLVTNIRIKPTGTMAAGGTFTLKFHYAVN